MLNGDVLTSLDLRAMMRYHREKGGVGTLHLIRVDDPSAFGCVVHDASGRVEAFVEKPPRDEAPTNEINAGTYLLERAVLDAIPAGRPVSIERETFPELIAAGRPLYAYTTADYWIDLGKPEAYLGAHRQIFDGVMPLGLRPDIDGPGRETIPARRRAAAVRRRRLPHRSERRRRAVYRARRRLHDRPGRRGRRFTAVGRRHGRARRSPGLRDRRQPRAHRRRSASSAQAR